MDGGTLEVTGSGNVTGRQLFIDASSTIQIDGGNSLTLNGLLQGFDGPALNVVIPSGGTLTLGGSADNDEFWLNVQSGTVVLAKSSASNVHAVAEITGVSGGHGPIGRHGR